MRSDRDDVSDVISDDTKPVPSRRGDVLAGPERRRRWAMAEKLAIVKESFADGAVVSHVAQRHGLSPQQLFGWQREIRELVLCKPELEGTGVANDIDFVPVAVANVPSAATLAASERAADAASSPATIEIELPGAKIRLSGTVDAKALTAVLKALKVLA